MLRVLLLIGIFLFCFPVQVSASQSLVINEFSPHPATGEKEWVEFYNPEGLALQGYFIDDDTSFHEDNGNSSKKSLESVSDSLYVVIEVSSMFNNSGDSVVLFDAQGAILDKFSYTEDAGSNVSLGRSPDGTGSFVPLSTISKGSVNSSPQPTLTDSPTPTSKPTPSSKPSPTLAKSPTMKKEPTLTKTASPLVSYEEGSKSPTKILKQIRKNVATNGAYPTAVLGTSSAIRKVTVHTKKPVLVKDAQDSKPFPHVLPLVIFIGCIFCACGIIFFVRMKRETWGGP